MHCNHCRNSVIRAISNVTGVDNVEVDLPSGIMVVTGPAIPTDVTQAIEALGFTVRKA